MASPPRSSGKVAETLGPTQHVAILDPTLGALNCGRYTVAIEAIRGTYTDGGSDVINRGILDIGPNGDLMQGAVTLLKALDTAGVEISLANDVQTARSAASDLTSARMEVPGVSITFNPANFASKRLTG